VDCDLGACTAGFHGSRRESPTTRTAVTIASPDLPTATGALTDLPGCLHGMCTVLAEPSLASHGSGTLGAARRALGGSRIHIGGTDGGPDHHHGQPAQQQVGQQDSHQDSSSKQGASRSRLGKTFQGNPVFGQQSDGEIGRDILDQIGWPLLRRDVQRVAVHLHPLDLHVANRLGKRIERLSLGRTRDRALTAREASDQQHGHQHHGNHCRDQDCRRAQAKPISALLLAFS